MKTLHGTLGLRERAQGKTDLEGMWTPLEKVYLVALDCRAVCWFGWSLLTRQTGVEKGWVSCGGVGVQGEGTPVQAGGLEPKCLCPEGCSIRRTIGEKPGEAVSEQKEPGCQCGQEARRA